MRLINADELRRKMCYKCIDTDEEMKKGRVKWDSGLWIRYKVFEDAVTLAPIVDAIKVVRCKDCKHYWKNNPSNDISVCLASSKDDAFCSEGKRRENETN